MKKSILILSTLIILSVCACKKKAESTTPSSATSNSNYCYTCWETNKTKDTVIGVQFSFCNKDTFIKYAGSNGPYYQCKTK